MKKTALISMAVSLGLASLSVNAENRHAVSSYMDLEVDCTCDWSTDTCTVSWNDVSARDYKVDIRFDAEWTQDDVSMSSEAKLKLNDTWDCDAMTGMCSTSGDFVLPSGYPDDATITFDARVRGVGSGPDGVTPRNFARDKAACNLPEPEEPAPPAFDPNLY